MDSAPDASAASDPRARMVHQLRERLEDAEALTVEMRAALAHADADAIDDATSRLGTVVLEFRLLEAEFRRLPRRDPQDAEDLILALEQFRGIATRVARSAAVGGGLLERLVGLSQKLISTLQAGGGEAYLPSGRSPEPTIEGVRLREEA